MAAMTTSPVSGTLYLLLKTDRIVCQITGALSVSQEDVEFYDGSTHSQLVDASIMGNPHMVPAPTQVLAGVQTIGNPAVTPTGLSTFPVLNQAETLAVTNATTDSDFVLTTTPGMTMKKDSLIKWWSGASASGNLVAMAWKSQIRYVGPVAPTLLS